MLRKNRRFLVFLNMLLEALIIFLSYQLALFIRYSLMHGEVGFRINALSFELLILGYSLAAVCLFYVFHLYIPLHQSPLNRELMRLVLLNIVAILSLGSVFYLLRLGDFSRMALGFFWLISTFFLALKRVCWRMISHRRFQRGRGLRRVILVGSGRLARRYRTDIELHPQFGRVVDGYISDREEERCGRYLGPLDELEQILESHGCDEVVVALEPNETAYIQAVLNTVEKEGLRVSMVPFYSDFFPSHPTIEIVGRSKLIDLRATPLDNLGLAILKRGFDVLGSALLILLLSPLMLVTAAGVKLSSPGPVFFKQRRVGKDKKEFTMLKFRSMRVNALESSGWSTDADPRRTRFGSFIRKYSIDELPQLFNVLKGEMSLVGPRPEVPFHVYRFKESVPLYLVRQQVRPGMTGWAQVHGLRGDTSIEERVEYDIWYIENWSLLLDVRILFLTLLGGFINAETIAADTREVSHV